MGVVFARFDEDDSVLGLAKNSERNLDGAEPETSAVEVVPQDETGE
jgi:DNA gyrase subunit A